MKIKQINSQYRRHFWADYECEHCGYIDRDQPGYDDSHFHKNVIPRMQCKNCGKTAPQNYIPLATKYPDKKVI